MSKIQATAIASMCTDELSSEIKALLAIDVVQIQWAQPEHAELILSKLAESDSRYAKKARRRRDQQDFEFITSYFTSEMWDTMLNAEVSADAKLLCIITHTIRMGLRLPTEPTHKLMCSLWTLISESTSTINRMDWSRRLCDSAGTRWSSTSCGTRWATQSCGCRSCQVTLATSPRTLIRCKTLLLTRLRPSQLAFNRTSSGHST